KDRQLGRPACWGNPSGSALRMRRKLGRALGARLGAARAPHREHDGAAHRSKGLAARLQENDVESMQAPLFARLVSGSGEFAQGDEQPQRLRGVAIAEPLALVRGSGLDLPELALEVAAQFFSGARPLEHANELALEQEDLVARAARGDRPGDGVEWATHSAFRLHGGILSLGANKRWRQLGDGLVEPVDVADERQAREFGERGADASKSAVDRGPRRGFAPGHERQLADAVKDEDDLLEVLLGEKRGEPGREPPHGLALAPAAQRPAGRAP